MLMVEQERIGPMCNSTAAASTNHELSADRSSALVDEIPQVREYFKK